MRTFEYIDDSTIDERTAGWLRQIRQAVAPRPGLQVDPCRAALLVIDMVRYFAHPGGRCFLPASAAIVPRIGQLLRAWRASGATVVYTQHCHKGPDDLGMLGKFFSDYIHAGEPDAEIIDALAPGPDARIFQKTTYDAFLGTDLQEILESMGVHQVVITGVLTHMCCETTARSAFCRGFEVYVPADATASSTEERHLSSLLALGDSVAVVMSAEEILGRCPSTK